MPIPFCSCLLLLSSCFCSSMRMAVQQAVRFLETVGEHELLVGKNPGGRSICDDESFIQGDRAGTELQDQLEIVGGNDLCRGEGLEKGFQFPLPARIKVAGWLIQNKDLRSAGEHPGKANALLLSSAQVMRRTFLKPCQS